MYSKQDCIEALQQAADILGKSPTVSEYRELDVSPSHTVFTDKFGSWNEAKKEAGLETYKDGSKPEIIAATQEEWEEFSHNKRQSLRKQAYVAKRKIDSGCEKCGYDKHPSALHFHHKDSSEKEKAVSILANQGYSIEKIDKEIEKCIVLCSNCHMIEESNWIDPNL